MSTKSLAKRPLHNLQKEIHKSTAACRKGINLWLKDQDLHLSDPKKDKIALLLLHYMSENGEITEDRVINLLGNLAGGHFDFDDMDSVETEIQRLLGHNIEKHRQRDRRFYRFIALAGLLAGIALSIAMLSISLQTKNLTTAQIAPPASDHQITELNELVQVVRDLRGKVGLTSLPRDEIIVILGEPLGIDDPKVISETQAKQLKGILKNIETVYLKKILTEGDKSQEQ